MVDGTGEGVPKEMAVTAWMARESQEGTGHTRQSMARTPASGNGDQGRSA
jgi:hypothetical protein